MLKYFDFHPIYKNHLYLNPMFGIYYFFYLLLLKIYLHYLIGIYPNIFCNIYLCNNKYYFYYKKKFLHPISPI